MDSGVRGTQHASRCGTPWGVKPADNGPASVSHTMDDRPTPATYADERNLRKRRNSKQVKVAVTPGPKWEGGGPAGSFLPLALSLNRSALSRQLRVARTSLLLELGNSHAAFPTLWGAKMPARGREGGGSVVAKRLAVMARTW